MATFARPKARELRRMCSCVFTRRNAEDMCSPWRCQALREPCGRLPCRLVPPLTADVSGICGCSCQSVRIDQLSVDSMLHTPPFCVRRQYMKFANYTGFIMHIRGKLGLSVTEQVCTSWPRPCLDLVAI